MKNTEILSMSAAEFQECQKERTSSIATYVLSSAVRWVSTCSRVDVNRWIKLEMRLYQYASAVKRFLNTVVTRFNVGRRTDALGALTHPKCGQHSAGVDRWEIFPQETSQTFL